MTLARVDNAPSKNTGEISLDLAEMRPVNKRCVKFKRAMLSNVLTAKAISRALLSSYLTRYIKNDHSVATTLLQFRNRVVDFVTVLSASFV